MNYFNPNEFVNPKQVRSPYTGETAVAKITNYDEGGRTYEQAVFTDPVTGQMIKRGLVSVKNAETGEVIASWDKVYSDHNNTTQSREQS